MIMEIQVGTGKDRWVKGLDLELRDHVGKQCVIHICIRLGSLVVGLLGALKHPKNTVQKIRLKVIIKP